MRKIVFLTAATAMALSLSACKKEEAAEPAAEATEAASEPAADASAAAPDASAEASESGDHGGGNPQTN
jgi:hypothetical protein